MDDGAEGAYRDGGRGRPAGAAAGVRGPRTQLEVHGGHRARGQERRNGRRRRRGRRRSLRERDRGHAHRIVSGPSDR